MASGPTCRDLVVPQEALATHCLLDAQRKVGAVRRPLEKGRLRPLDPTLRLACLQVADALTAAGMFCPVGTFKHYRCRAFLRHLLPPGVPMPTAGTCCCMTFRPQVVAVLTAEAGAPTTARYNRKNLPGVVDFLKAWGPREAAAAAPVGTPPGGAAHAPGSEAQSEAQSVPNHPAPSKGVSTWAQGRHGEDGVGAVGRTPTEEETRGAVEALRTLASAPPPASPTGFTLIASAPRS